MKIRAVLVSKPEPVMDTVVEVEIDEVTQIKILAQAIAKAVTLGDRVRVLEKKVGIHVA